MFNVHLFLLHAPETLTALAMATDMDEGVKTTLVEEYEN